MILIFMVLPLQFPSLKKKFDFKAHEGEVEDLDIGPGNQVTQRKPLLGLDIPFGFITPTTLLARY